MEKYSVKFNGKEVLYTDIHNPWRFVTADRQPYETQLKLIKNTYEETEISVSSYVYENSSKTVSAKRICFSDEKNIVFFVDFIESAEDVCVYTDFTVANFDLSASCNVADKNKLVIRNHHCGIKHFRMDAALDGTSILDKTGLMMPASIKENGDITYAMYDGLYGFGKKHMSCYVLSSEKLDQIAFWHLKGTQRGYLAEAPNRTDGVEIEILDDCINLYDHNTGEHLINLKHKKGEA